MNQRGRLCLSMRACTAACKENISEIFIFIIYASAMSTVACDEEYFKVSILLVSYVSASLLAFLLGHSNKRGQLWQIYWINKGSIISIFILTMNRFKKPTMMLPAPKRHTDRVSN